ncbi:hypothetical protein B0J11DRAFT_568163 [Dendryphion nanum]|uniref:Uncharacterized protein n=1 Tax=Dendryphion nanum TaxID=256645 RepID=A0A9P9DRI9_9PLEO|nr:hypothetical protein B0J11DRAFT_568163 [Dendryphion nanum]
MAVSNLPGLAPSSKLQFGGPHGHRETVQAISKLQTLEGRTGHFGDGNQDGGFFGRIREVVEGTVEGGMVRIVIVIAIAIAIATATGGATVTATAMTATDKAASRQRTTLSLSRVAVDMEISGMN